MTSQPSIAAHASSSGGGVAVLSVPSSADPPFEGKRERKRRKRQRGKGYSLRPYHLICLLVPFRHHQAVNLKRHCSRLDIYILHGQITPFTHQSLERLPLSMATPIAPGEHAAFSTGGSIEELEHPLKHT